MTTYIIIYLWKAKVFFLIKSDFFDAIHKA